MRVGDMFGPHSDHHQGRHIAFVVYLSAAWKPDYGGGLHIIGKDDACSEIEPTPNSLVVFDITTQKWHYITDIPSIAGDRSRLTVSGWFFSSDRI